MTLTGNTRNILSVLSQSAPDALSDLAIKDLARDCSISKLTVKRHLKALRALGLINCERPCPGLTYSYSVSPRARSVLRT